MRQSADTGGSLDLDTAIWSHTCDESKELQYIHGYNYVYLLL